MNSSNAPAGSLAPLPWRVASVAATLAGIALVACVIAFWGWQWFGPAPVHIPAGMPADPAAALANSGLFGKATDAPASTVALPEVVAGESRLLGVFAEPQGKGYALLRLPGGSTRLVAAGQPIDATTTLVAVRPDGITIRDSGGERTLALRRGAEPAATRPTGATSTVRAAACAVPAGFNGMVVRLNAELVQGLIAQPDSWRNLVETQQGALVIREDGSFAAMLGLKRGDRIEQANGIALRGPDDVIGAVLRPLIDNQSVRLSGMRNGERRELLLQNAGRCAG